jgi:hypothetical protein
VDALITAMTSAKTEAQLLPACHALERVIAHSHYLMPAVDGWHPPHGLQRLAAGQACHRAAIFQW